MTTEKIRKRLEDDIKKYLADGKRITQVPAGYSAETKPSKLNIKRRKPSV